MLSSLFATSFTGYFAALGWGSLRRNRFRSKFNLLIVDYNCAVVLLVAGHIFFFFRFCSLSMYLGCACRLLVCEWCACRFRYDGMAWHCIVYSTSFTALRCTTAVVYIRVLNGYPSVHGAFFFNRKSYGPVRCGTTKAEILRCGFQIL